MSSQIEVQTSTQVPRALHHFDSVFYGIHHILARLNFRKSVRSPSRNRHVFVEALHIRSGVSWNVNREVVEEEGDELLEASN